MKVVYMNSFQLQRRSQGDRTCITVSLEPENDLEKAIMRLCRSSAKREVSLCTGGNMEVTITMPRGKY